MPRSSPRASTTRPWPPGWARGRSRSPSWCPAWASASGRPRSPGPRAGLRCGALLCTRRSPGSCGRRRPPAAAAGAGGPAGGRCLLAAVAGVPGPRPSRGPAAAGRDLPRRDRRSRARGRHTMSQLVREGHLLGLRGLDRGEVRGLVEALAGVEPSEAMVAAVHEATEGQPAVRPGDRAAAGRRRHAEGPGRLRCRCPGACGRRSGGGWPLCPPTPCRCCRWRRWWAGSSTCRCWACLRAADRAHPRRPVGSGGAGRGDRRRRCRRPLPLLARPDPGGALRAAADPGQVDLHRRVGASIEASTAAAWTPMSPSSPTTSARPRPPARPPRRWPTPAAPASAPWTCTPTRRPPPSTGGRCRPCGSSARTSRCAASCCCGSARPWSGRDATGRRRRPAWRPRS